MRTIEAIVSVITPRLRSLKELLLDDGYQDKSNWGPPKAGIKLASSTAEWDAFRTTFGEVSLLRAITVGYDPDAGSLATGFPSRSDSTLTFDDATQTFTIAPAGVQYSIFVNGVERVINAPQTYVWPDTEGLWLVYFNAAGVLQATQSTTVIDSVFSGGGAAVAAFYWDAANNLTIRRIDERHGVTMSGATHIYLHKYFGTAYESGGALGDFSLVAGAPSTAAAAQFSVADTVVSDEDLRRTIIDGSPQDLSPLARIPIYFLSGAGVWRRKAPDDFPVIYSGTAGYVGASGRLPYNQFTGGAWQLTEVANNNYVLLHVFATTDIDEPIIGVMGQATYATLAAARQGANTETNALVGLLGLLSTEKRALGTVIYQTATAASNVPKAKVVVTDTGANYVDWRATPFVSGLVAVGASTVTPLQIAGAYASNWAVPDWYVNGTTGDDANTGTAEGAPLRTGAELRRRLGPYALWSQSVTIHVTGEMTDALLLRGAMLNAGDHLDLLGTATQLVDAGTIATYGGIDHATPREPYFTSTNVADWAPYRWARARLTSGADTGAVCWLAQANPGGAGANVVSTCRWSRVHTTATQVFLLVTPTVGTSVVVESVPYVPSITILLDGPVAAATVAPYPGRQIRVSSLSTRMLSIDATCVGTSGRLIMDGCEIEQTRMVGKYVSNNTAFVLQGCLIAARDTTTSLNANGAYQACLFGKNYSNVQNFYGQQMSCTACLFQGVTVSPGQGCFPSLIDCQIFDISGATTAAFSLATNSMVNVFTGLSGARIAGYGITCTNNVTGRLVGTINLVAAAALARLTTGSAINLPSYAALTQPNDYAQKGQATLAGGTVTVTVTWYSSSTQRVTATHATFGGTPGTLSIQQISDTQFTITSSSAADTSTVNWSISPLGRNITLSTA